MNPSQPPSSDPLYLLARQTDRQIDLATGALLIAQLAAPELDLDHYREKLADLAAKAKLSPQTTPRAQLEKLSHFLFAELNFKGSDQANYYDPRNSFLSDVIERRVGIPISLALLYITLGRRQGLALEGVSFPGHFLTLCTDTPEATYIDAFNRGRLLFRPDLENWLTRLPAANRPSLDQALQPALHSHILARVLRNLMLVYHQRADWERAALFGERVLWFQRDTLQDYRDLGLVFYRAGRYRRALTALETYIEKAGITPETQILAAQVKRLAARIGSFN